MIARLTALAVASGLMLASAASAGAATAPGSVELTISGGRVSLVARNASVGEILEEWSRVGQTRIVNGDRVPGGLVTLQLDNVSEPEALDILLRSAAGFVAVRRPAILAAASEFERILILPASTAPVGAVAMPQPQPQPPQRIFPEPQEYPPQDQPGITPGVQRVIGPDGLPVPDDQDGTPPPPRPASPPDNR